MDPLNPEEQSANDRSEIKIKVIENGILIRTGSAWLAYDSWARASSAIGHRIEQIKKARTGVPKGGC